MSPFAQPLTFREKDEVVLVLTQIRLTIYSQAGEAIPASIALFLAHCVSLIGAPESPLYPPFMRFLLQRSTIDVRDVPLFYNMLYSSNTDEYAAAPREERAWMVRYLTEGLVRSQVRALAGTHARDRVLMAVFVQDWKIYRRRQVFELLASLFEASRQDPPLRKLILKVSLPACLLLLDLVLTFSRRSSSSAPPRSRPPRASSSPATVSLAGSQRSFRSTSPSVVSSFRSYATWPRSSRGTGWLVLPTLSRGR